MAHFGKSCSICCGTPDQVHQLQHELSKKDELLRMVASASEESETDSSVSTPLRQPQPIGGTTAAALSQLESLQNKLQELEEENLSLRTEVRLSPVRELIRQNGSIRFVKFHRLFPL